MWRWWVLRDFFGVAGHVFCVKFFGCTIWFSEFTSIFGRLWFFCCRSFQKSAMEYYPNYCNPNRNPASNGLSNLGTVPPRTGLPILFPKHNMDITRTQAIVILAWYSCIYTLCDKPCTIEFQQIHIIYLVLSRDSYKHSIFWVTRLMGADSQTILAGQKMKTSSNYPR